MTMDRVEINGVWYVREEVQVEKQNGFNFIEMELDPTHTEDLIYEDERYLLEFSVIKNVGTFTMAALEIQDKLTEETEYWDNEHFLLNLSQLNETSIESALVRVGRLEITDELLNIIINLLKDAVKLNLL